MSAAPFRLGLVGCGRLAEQGYVPAVAGLADVVVVAVADPDPARRARVAALVGGGPPVATHPDAAALVAGADLDAVVVASPVDRHPTDAAVVAAAGLVGLVEKPPAVDAEAARALTTLDPPPWIGFNRRFDLGARRVRAAVPVAGHLRVELELGYRRASWRAHAVADDALLDLGPHVVDLAGWLTGDVVREVRAATVAHDRAAARLRLDRADVAIAVACDRPYREAITVRDASGTVIARETLGGPTRALWSRVRPGPHPLVASLTREVAAVVAAARGAGRGALADPVDALRVMTVIDAIRTSAAEGGRVVPLAPEDPPCS